jgi:hypothetical protein
MLISDLMENLGNCVLEKVRSNKQFLWISFFSANISEIFFQI